MGSTISIIIKGIAICYQKEIDGKTVWRILFPFNECHKASLSYEKGEIKGFVRNLGKPRSRVEISAASLTGSSNSTDNFKNQVLDLTLNTLAVKTHSKIALKPDWYERGVLLTIPDIVFDVRKTLLCFDEVKLLEEIFLYNPGAGTKQTLIDLRNSTVIINVAHSIKGSLQLAEGESLNVIADAETIFTTDPDTNYTLTFDNDCSDIERLPDGRYRNDMEMIYQLFQEPERPNHQFLVEATGGDQAEPPQLTQGKPCLVVKVTDPVSVQDLP